MAGPLGDLRVLEIAGIGPAPMGTMLLADLGADVIRLDRPGGQTFSPVSPELDVLGRGRRSVVVDLKDAADRGLALELAAGADVLVEGFRPGVAERLGIGPADCQARNPRLVYARVTGWGQTGPLAERAGHDLAYIARTGALDTIGPAGAPVMPVNYLGDFGGGGMYLAFGILAAVHHAAATGHGQVIDVAITDGTALLLSMLHTHRNAGIWEDRRGVNLLDGGAHYYHVYATADGRHLAVACLEPRFYAAFLTGLGVELDAEWTAAHTDRSRWPAMRERVAEIIAGGTLADWVAVYADSDACVAPVLTVAEAARDEHNAARGTFVEIDGHLQAAPGPRFSATPAGRPSPPPAPGEHSAEVRRGVAEGSAWRAPGSAAP